MQYAFPSPKIYNDDDFHNFVKKPGAGYESEEDAREAFIHELISRTAIGLAEEASNRLIASKIANRIAQRKSTSDATEEQSTASNNGNTQAAKANAATTTATTPLNWSRINKKGETATDHVNLHGKNDISKDLHGVFSGDPVMQTNNAWNNKGNIQPTRQANGNDLYVIPSPKAGTEGGSKGSGAVLNNISIITVGGSTKVVTSFPSN